MVKSTEGVILAIPLSRYETISHKKRNVVREPHISCVMAPCGLSLGELNGYYT